MDKYQHFTVEEINDVVVLRLTTEEFIGPEITSRLEEELLDFVDSERPSELLVTFERVRRLSSQAVNALLQARAKLRNVNGTVNLCGLRQEIYYVFEVLNLDGTAFEIHENFAEALDSF